MFRRLSFVLGIVLVGISFAGGFTHGKETGQSIVPYLFIPTILIPIASVLVFQNVQKKAGPLIFWGVVGAVAGALVGATVFSLANLSPVNLCCLTAGVVLCLLQPLERWQTRRRRSLSGLGMVKGARRFGIVRDNGTIEILSPVHRWRPPQARKLSAL